MRMDNHVKLFGVCIIGALLLFLSLLTFLLPNNIKREISYIEQIAQDWERRPFVEIKVVKNGGCQPGWDPVFYKEWGGLEYDCLRTTGGKNNKRCVESISSPPYILAELEGDTICGRRGGRQFVDTFRPNSDGECPNKTVPCSEITSPENTICVESKESDNTILDDCPITEIKLVNEDQLS